MCHLAITLKTRLVISGGLTVVVATRPARALKHLRGLWGVKGQALQKIFHARRRALPGRSSHGGAGMTRLLPPQQWDAILVGFARQRRSGEFREGQLGAIE